MSTLPQTSRTLFRLSFSTFTCLVTAAFSLAGCGGSVPEPNSTGPSGGAGTENRSEQITAPAALEGGRLPQGVRPTHYSLRLAIDPSQEGLSGEVAIDVQLPEATDRIYLHGASLVVREASVVSDGGDTHSAQWMQVATEGEGPADASSGLGALMLQEPVGPGSVQLRIRYSAPYNGGLEGLYRVEQQGRHYVYSQFEPLAARQAFPCFDEPGFKAPYDVTLVVPEGMEAIANGRQLGVEPAEDGGQVIRYATTPPLPTYLVAFAVGPFDVVEGPALAPNDVRSQAIPFRGVAPRGQGAQMAYALEQTGAIVAALENYFGIPYPFDKLDILAVPDFEGGAMENAGAITFRSQLLLLNAQSPVRQRRGFAFTMAHELAHQWFGNLVTMQWWDDLWLNEAFATWMETGTIAATFPEFSPQTAEMSVALSAMRADSLRSARQIHQPIVSEHDIHNAFDAITYSKGNAVLAMFERYLTPEVFQRGIRRYLAAHQGGTATAADLLDALSEEAGRDVRPAFESFLDQPGVPQLAVSASCSEGAGSLSVSQSRYLPLGSAAEAERSWQVPFCFRYGVGRATHQQCALLTESQAQVPLTEGCADWLMPNAGGTGYYRWSLPPAQLSALRLRGLSHLDTREAMALADSLQAGFAAGQISFADAMTAVAPLARRSERALASAPMKLVSFAIDHLLTDSEVVGARTRAQLLYRSQVRRLGWEATSSDESPDQRLLRNEVLTFMAMVGRDRGVRREGNRRGRAYLGLGDDTATDSEEAAASEGAADSGGALHPEALASDLRQLGLSIAVQEGGAEVFDHMLSLYSASTDPQVRSELLKALSSVQRLALRTRVLDLLLSEGLRVNETFSPLMGQAHDPEGLPVVWAWLQEHYDALSQKMGATYSGYLPYVGSVFCSTERAAEVARFFESRVGATQGGPRNLEASVETIRLCAARAEHGRQSAAAYFSRR